MAVLAIPTLIYLKREYAKKYKPYFDPVVCAEPIKENAGYMIFVTPFNVGHYPAEIKIINILLKIGDEKWPTPLWEVADMDFPDSL